MLADWSSNIGETDKANWYSCALLSVIIV